MWVWRKLVCPSAESFTSCVFAVALVDLPRVRERVRDAVRRFVEDERGGRGAQGCELEASRVAARGKKTREVKFICRQTGSDERRDEGRRAGDGRDVDASLD